MFFIVNQIDEELSMSIILKFLNLKISQWCPAYAKEEIPEDLYHINILINTLLWVTNDCHMQGWIIWKLCRVPWILKTSTAKILWPTCMFQNRPFPIGAVHSLRRCHSYLWGRLEVGVHLPVPLLLWALRCKYGRTAAGLPGLIPVASASETANFGPNWKSGKRSRKEIHANSGSLTGNCCVENVAQLCVRM